MSLSNWIEFNLVLKIKTIPFSKYERPIKVLTDWEWTKADPHVSRISKGKVEGDPCILWRSSDCLTAKLALINPILLIKSGQRSLDREHWSKLKGDVFFIENKTVENYL